MSFSKVAFCCCKNWNTAFNTFLECKSRLKEQVFLWWTGLLMCVFLGRDAIPTQCILRLVWSQNQIRPPTLLRFMCLWNDWRYHQRNGNLPLQNQTRELGKCRSSRFILIPSRRSLTAKTNTRNQNLNQLAPGGSPLRPESRRCLTRIEHQSSVLVLFTVH